MQSEVIALRSPRARTETTAWLGMIIFLGSWAMLFAALFFAYGVLRFGAMQWPPAGTPVLPVLLPAGNTLVILASSVALQLGLGAARRGRASLVAPAVGASLLLGLGFLALQTLLWMRLIGSGLRPQNGPYASVFYAFTAFHAVHVAGGIVALAWLLIRALQGAFTPARHLHLRLWTLYWHFVGAVWLLLFVTLFAL